MGIDTTIIAGTNSLQNNEIAACLTIVHALTPDTVAFNACSNLTLAPRTAHTVFARPEQILIELSIFKNLYWRNFLCLN